MFAGSATALRLSAARAWGPFGCRFGKSVEDRNSMDRGSVVEIFGARWAKFEDGDGRDFRLRFPRLLKVLVYYVLIAEDGAFRMDPKKE